MTEFTRSSSFILIESINKTQINKIIEEDEYLKYEINKEILDISQILRKNKSLNNLNESRNCSKKKD